MPKPAALLAAFAVCVSVMAGCASSTGTMQKKLEAISEGDLQDIIAEIPPKAKASKLARPYYKIDEYKEFHGDTATVFQAMATVYFFYLDPSIDLCQRRKYRYKRTAGMWDRYEVQLVHIPSKYSGLEGQ